MRKYKNQPTFVAELMWLPQGNHRLLNVEWYNEVVWLPFEMFFVPAPKTYLELLEHLYGDWHKFVKGGSIHGDVFFDPEKPYMEYIK